MVFGQFEERIKPLPERKALLRNGLLREERPAERNVIEVAYVGIAKHFGRQKFEIISAQAFRNTIFEFGAQHLADFAPDHLVRYAERQTILWDKRLSNR